jgi:AcrR family transcriptional regulator
MESKPKTTKASTTPKRPWAYGELTVADVVASAMSLIERDGIEKLTMRRLAEELGMSSMVTYYYVPSKEALLDLVIDEVYGRIEVPGPEYGDWKARLSRFFSDARVELYRYPGLIQVIHSRPMTASGKQLAAAWQQILREAGLDENVGVMASGALFYYCLGVLSWEAHAAPVPKRGTSSQSDNGYLGRIMRGSPTLEESFDFGIDLLVRGLASCLAEQEANRGEDQS